MLFKSKTQFSQFDRCATKNAVSSSSAAVNHSKMYTHHVITYLRDDYGDKALLQHYIRHCGMRLSQACSISHRWTESATPILLDIEKHHHIFIIISTVQYSGVIHWFTRAYGRLNEWLMSARHIAFLYFILAVAHAIFIICLHIHFFMALSQRNGDRLSAREGAEQNDNSNSNFSVSDRWIWIFVLLEVDW